MGQVDTQSDHRIGLAVSRVCAQTVDLVRLGEDY